MKIENYFARFNQQREVTVICRGKAEGRLAGTCFRLLDEPRAGNFMRLASAQDLAENELVREAFMKSFIDASEDELGIPDTGLSRTIRFCVDLGCPVGWTSTDLVTRYSDDVLEPFNPNRVSAALRVKLSQTLIKAPKTSLVTIVYELRNEAGNLIIVIHTTYPGPDIGPIEGDITANKGVVFFDFNHAGE